jgi:osmoprotectant transport system permease protein
MVIALSVYGVALLVRTAEDAFTSVDPEVRDAAIAMGESPRSVFWRVDLPLSLPVLISGIRVVAVSTIALVTIGALIGVSGLGTLLTDGFQRGIMAEVVTGVVATMLLAVIVDGLILGLGRLLTPWRRNRKTSGAGSEER